MRVVEHAAPVTQPPSTYSIEGLTREQMVQLAVLLGKSRGGYRGPINPSAGDSLFVLVAESVFGSAREATHDEGYIRMSENLIEKPFWVFRG